METESRVESPHPRQRRWLRFSLRGLFLAITIGCVWLGFAVYRAREQQRLVALLRSVGGVVFYDYQIRKHSPGDYLPRSFSVEPPWGEWSTREILYDLCYSAELANLYTPEITDQTLRDMRGLSNLSEISISDSSITNEGLKHLAQFPRLETFYINEAWFDDVGMSHLRNCRGLRTLIFDSGHFTDASIPDFAALPELRTLEIMAHGLSPDGVKQLGKALPNCQIKWFPVERW